MKEILKELLKNTKAMLKVSRSKGYDIFLFFLFSILTIIIQLKILQPVVKYQLIELVDDWHFLNEYKSLYYLSFFPKLLHIWKSGIHESGYLVYMGIIGEILGGNYQAYNYVSIYLKIFSTITLYPLILIVFRNRLLAFLTALFYGITSASTGSLYWVLKGVTFLGTALMNLFLIAYYYTIVKDSRGWFLLSALLLFLSYTTSAVRIYPVFLIIILVELYLVITGHSINRYKLPAFNLSVLKKSLVRLLVYFLPIVILTIQASVSPRGAVEKKPTIIFNYLKDGNLHDILSPIAGLGYSFFTNHYWPFFGQITTETFAGFGNYLNFIIRGPLIIFGLSTAVLSFIIAKNWRRFLIRIISLNLIFQIVMYFIATYHFLIPESLWFEHATGLYYLLKYPTLVGIYVVVVVLVSFLEWRKDRKNKLLLALWVGPSFSLIFLWAMWVFLGYLVNAYSSTGYYFAIPSMGMSLFVAAVLSLLYKRLNKNIGLRIVSFGLIVVTIFIVYITSSLEITQSFTNDNPGKITVEEQMVLHEKIFQKLGSAAQDGNLLIYFEVPNDYLGSNYYDLALRGFPEMISFRRNNQGTGCVGYIVEKSTLISAQKSSEVEQGFVYNGRCVLKSESSSINEYSGKKSFFYDVDDFYAFRLQDKNVIDIKSEILSELLIDTK